jgi:hypothetical protein
MQSIYGNVVEILRDPTGRANGLVLDSGEEISFSADQLGHVAEVATLNASIQIMFDLQNGSKEQRVLTATQITNLDSKQTASLQAPVCLRKPGMSAEATPTTPASLAHLKVMEEDRPKRTDPRGERSLDPIGLLLEKMASQPRPSRYASDEDPQRGLLPLPRAMRRDAATEIEHAYDSLHRIQAILAYLKIMKRQVHGMSQMHEEAKHTYEQALSRHAARDFEGARELAAASGCLSRVVEGIISRTLRSDTSYPSLVSPPPQRKGICGDASRVDDDLDAVEAVLSRIHWLMENGTLPLEDRAQVRRIAAWGDAFYQQARRMFQHGSHEDAAELAEAAVDAAHSAEHICRNWYVAHTADSPHDTIPADRSPQV